METVKTRDNKEIEESKLKTDDLQNLEASTATLQGTASLRAESPRRERSYSDVPGLRHETKDVLQQLQANINYLEDLGGRLGYVLSEVRTIIRR